MAAVATMSASEVANTVTITSAAGVLAMLDEPSVSVADSPDPASLPLLSEPAARQAASPMAGARREALELWQSEWGWPVGARRGVGGVSTENRSNNDPPQLASAGAAEDLRTDPIERHCG